MRIFKISEVLTEVEYLENDVWITGSCSHILEFQIGLG